MFTTRSNILECIDRLKLKNTEGYDRIPQRIFIDGRDFSIEPLSNLFELFSHFIKVFQGWPKIWSSACATHE